MIRLMSVPADARYELAIMREGVDEASYRNFIWARREFEHPRESVSTGPWPYIPVKIWRETFEVLAELEIVQTRRKQA